MRLEKEERSWFQLPRHPDKIIGKCADSTWMGISRKQRSLECELQMPISSWAKVKVLVWADIVPYFVLWMLLTYLTDVWNLNFTRSAEIVNFFYGMVAIMPVAMQLIVDTILGDYWMVVLSSFAYSAGLGLLTMSTPPVLSRVTGNCSVYESQCLGPVQKLLFYTALLLIALGMAGHLTSVQTLIDSERRTTSPTPSTLFAFLVWTLKVFGPLFVGWALGLIKSWWVLFAIAAVTSLGAMAVFLTGSYVERPEARDSALTTMLRVFVASAFKTFLTHPGWDKLYGANDNNIDQIPYTPRLRFLDKAAIKLPAQENNRWRLCRVTEVEETKSLIYMLPVCLNFIPMGVVASIGNTYFVEQANQDANVPVIFLSLHEYAKAASLLFVDEIPREKLLILASMTCTVLCCIVAGTVENRRLSVGRSHGLLDNPSQRIPMSSAWLIPQFVLLGLFSGIKERTFIHVVKRRASQPATVGRYKPLGHALFGLGVIGSVLSVFVVSAIKPSWFQATLNKSRLDNYYWTLVSLTAVNLLIYCCTMCFDDYSYSDEVVGTTGEVDGEELPMNTAPDP